MQIDPTSLPNRADRLALGRTGTLRDPDRAPIDVVIDNLSDTGALLRTATQLPVGTLVSLGIAGLGMQMARIVRASPGALAAEFLLPLDRQALARIATDAPLTSIAIPQLPARAAAAADGGPGASGPASVLPLPVTPLPPPLYDASGRRPAIGPVEDAMPAINPRMLAGTVGADRPAAPGLAGRGWLWLVALVLLGGLAYLLL